MSTTPEIGVRSRIPNLLGERMKVLAMGIVLALLLFAFFFPGNKPKPSGTLLIKRPPPVRVEPFRPDSQILAQIKDTEKADRAYIEHVPWSHLVKKSYNIGAAVAEALRRESGGASIKILRAEPAKHRGSFVRFKGRLDEFRAERMMHPLPRATVYKGRLITSEGDPVIFFVSKPLAENILEDKDSWVRMEGFFMKIRDEYLLPANQADIIDAPLLIGPRLEKAYPDWHAVEKLDPAVVQRVKNARFDKKHEMWLDDEHMYTMLTDSEDVPLWHVASYAIRQHEQVEETGQRHPVIFEVKDQYTKFKTGEFPQGEPVRLRGSFITARVFRAKTNPVGIKYWSEVWMRIPRLGAKLIPLWIPRDIGDWNVGDSLDLDAFFFKNYGYAVQEGPDRHTPLFVAGGLRSFALVSHPATKWIGLGFASFLLMIGIVFFRMNRRARLESAEYKAKLVERRRTRRLEHHHSRTLQAP